MKRVSHFLFPMLAVLLLISLTACGETPASVSEDTGEDPEPVQETINPAEEAGIDEESGVASGTGTHTNPFDFDRRMGDYIGGYHTMEEAVAEGKVRSIGVSNFSTAQFEEIMAEAVIPPPPYSRWKRICITSKTA